MLLGKEPTTAVDYWSFGVVVFQLLTGERDTVAKFTIRKVTVGQETVKNAF